jgi:hypothetical protein
MTSFVIRHPSLKKRVPGNQFRVTSYEINCGLIIETSAKEAHALGHFHSPGRAVFMTAEAVNAFFRIYLREGVKCNGLERAEAGAFAAAGAFFFIYHRLAHCDIS